MPRQLKEAGGAVVHFRYNLSLTKRFFAPNPSMRAVCFQDIKSVAVQSIADPIIEQPSDAIVKVWLAGLCGSDLHPYFGREAGLDVGTAMGHEFVGEVVQLGSEVKTFQTGDRICSPFTSNCGHCFYCQRGLTARCENGQLFGWRESGIGLHGGQAELVRVPNADATLVRIPDDISNETALLLGDNLSTGYFGASMAIDPQTPKRDTLAVIGCGTVGLLAIQSARWMGAENIFAYDPNEARRSLANQLGAHACPDEASLLAQIADATGGRGADGVMEFVGLAAAQRLAYQVIRPGGRMAVIGCHCTPHFAFSPTQAYDKNLTYSTGRCSARFIMGRLIDQHHELDMSFDWCITHRFSIEDGKDAYDVFSQRRDGCVKAVLEF